MAGRIVGYVHGMARRLLLLALASLVLAGCGSGEGGSTPNAAPRSTEGTLSGTNLDGEPVSLDDFRGKPVFVNVWSSW
jgi:hypothetical protein